MHEIDQQSWKEGHASLAPSWIHEWCFSLFGCLIWLSWVRSHLNIFPHKAKEKLQKSSLRKSEDILILPPIRKASQSTWLFASLPDPRGFPGKRVAPPPPPPSRPHCFNFMQFGGYWQRNRLVPLLYERLDPPLGAVLTGTWYRIILNVIFTLAKMQQHNWFRRMSRERVMCEEQGCWIRWLFKGI